MYPDYQPPKPRRSKKKLILIISAVVLLVLVAATAGYFLTMGAEKQLDDNAVRDEAITQNKQLRASMVDGVVSEDAIVRTKSTDRATIVLAITDDRKDYCVEAISPKNSDSVRFHMNKDTPELEPVKGLCGESAKSSPAAPASLLLESSSAKSVSLSWSVIPDASSYVMQCSTSEAFTTIAASGESNVPRGTVANLNETETYFCRVASKNSMGQSSWTDSVRTKTKLFAQWPADLTVSTISSSSLEYSWKPVAGAKYYVLEYAKDVNFTDSVVSLKTTNTKGRADNLGAYTLYYFRNKVVTDSFNEAQAPFGPAVPGRTNK